MRIDRLIPLKEFVAQHPRLRKEGTLRRWIRENYRGFAHCAVKVREKYHIDPDAVEEWLEAQQVNQLADICYRTLFRLNWLRVL